MRAPPYVDADAAPLRRATRDATRFSAIYADGLRCSMLMLLFCRLWRAMLLRRCRAPFADFTLRCSFSRYAMFRRWRQERYADFALRRLICRCGCDMPLLHAVAAPSRARRCHCHVILPRIMRATPLRYAADAPLPLTLPMRHKMMLPLFRRLIFRALPPPRRAAATRR